MDETVMVDFCEQAVPGVRRLQPYQPGKPIEDLQRELGLSRIIKLASNENPLGPSPKALSAVRSEDIELARYPDGNGFALKGALSEQLGVSVEQLTLGNGSNDVLELLTRAFVQPGDEVIFSRHAFAVYPIVTQAVGGKAVVTPAKDWGHDLEAMAQAITGRTRVIFVTNPNNPTGTWVNEKTLLQLLNQVPAHVLVVLDEAYYEYAAHPDMGAPDYPNGLKLLGDFPNLIVTRTFSKAHGLAGLRVGYAVSNPDIADVLNRVRQPFNVNTLAQKAAVAALADTDHIERSVKVNVEGMKQLTAAFDDMGLDYVPSLANFISVDVGEDARGVYESLLRQGVIVRPIANYEMPRHLRVTIGTAEENDVFLNALRSSIV